MSDNVRAAHQLAATLMDEHRMDMEGRFYAAAKALRAGEDATSELEELRMQLEYTQSLCEKYVRLQSGRCSETRQMNRAVSVDDELPEAAERRIRDETGETILGDMVADRALRLREQLANANEIVPEGEPVIEHALRLYATLENPEDLLGDTADLPPTGLGSHPR